MASLKLRRGTESKDESVDVIEVPLEVASSSFLGTLRSDDDDEQELVGAFAVAYQQYSELRIAYFSGKINRAQFGRALSEIKCYDVNGGEWAIGATSGQWYQRMRPSDPWVAMPIDQAIRDEISRMSAAARNALLGTPSTNVRAMLGTTPVDEVGSSEDALSSVLNDDE